ncbi:MAG: hypothetical protein ACYC26_02685 [Phycisphaerales bacterium]
MPNHWPDPSWFDRFLLENPWPALAVFAAFALIFVRHYLRQRRGILLILALCCVVVAAVVPLLACLITTPRERLMLLDAQFVHAVASNLSGAGADIPALERLLSPAIDFQISSPAVTQSHDRKALLELIDRVLRKYHPHDAILLDNDARHLPTGQYESCFRVRVRLDASSEGPLSVSNLTVTTDWLLQWSGRPDGSFRITTLRWLKIDGRDPAASLLP